MLDFLYSYPSGDEGSYLNLGLHDGVIYLAMDMGDGEKVDLIGGSGRRFDDDIWHDIIIERETRSVSLDYQQRRYYLPGHAINIPTMQLFATIPDIHRQNLIYPVIDWVCTEISK